MPKDIVKQAIARLGGWVVHDGGDCPLHYNTIIVSQTNRESREEGEIYGPHPAHKFCWDEDEAEAEGVEYVIAYRIVKRAE